MKHKHWFAVILAFSVLSPAFADVEAVVEYRQGVMEANGGHMAALKAIFIGGQKQFLPHAVEHGEAIAGIAESIPDMFPPDSTHRKSEARKRIWRNWDDFVARARTLERLSLDFVEAAKSGDETAMTQAFKKMGKEGCSACHERYRDD
ncbi:MAG: c-type cytochrome [Methylohalobius sp. ZOD2]|nr:cytochrome c [Methylothermaceae bacterium]